MEISPISLVLCGAILILGRCLGSTLIIALVASCAFGSTAVATVSAVGGSSPLIYNCFAALLIGLQLVNGEAVRNTRTAFERSWTPWVVCAFVYYAVVSTLFMPRLFQGQTSAFLVSKSTGFVEVSLEYTMGNLLQTGYLVLYALTYFAIDIAMVSADRVKAIKRAFFAWAAIIAVTGAADVVAKSAGLGDVFAMIRTANYSFLTEDVLEGLSRINGTFSEASAFAGSALGALAFSFSYWRCSGSRGALILTVTLLGLLMLSTSSTAYVGLAALIVPYAAGYAKAFFRGRLDNQDIIGLFIPVAGVALIIGFLILDSQALDPVFRVLDTTIFEKSQSESGRERGYMNQISLQNVVDTWGLGIGYGSSRSSSWLLAVFSQMGIIGSLLQFMLIIPFLRGLRRPEGQCDASESYFLYRSVRACSLALLISQSISATNANPGILFFVALAVVRRCRAFVEAGDDDARDRPRASDPNALGSYDMPAAPPRLAWDGPRRLT